MTKQNESIQQYADILAGNPGAVPAADVAWKLRQILNDTTDAPVKYSARMALRSDVGTPVLDAKRRLYAHIIASAHRLDQPFTNAPQQSPWTQLKRAMAALDEALIAVGLGPQNQEADK